MLIRNEHKPYMAYKKEEKIQPALKSNYRLPTLFGAISAVFVGLIGYSFFVQEKYHQELSSSSEARLVRTIREPALRGAIVDRNGTILAVSRYLKIATFNPRAIYAPKRKGDTVNWNTISDAQFRQLAEVLQVPEAEVRAKLQNLSSQYVQFKTELSLEDADKLKALGVPTLYFEERTERSYPTGNLFSHIVGFSNNKGQGLEGLELSQNKTLTGEDGKQMVLRDRHRNVIELIDSPENVVAKSGETVTLSLDYNMQRLAREQLQAALTQFKAKAGGAVVLDAQTGEVLAMSSLPDYDANHYGEYPVESRRNFTVGVTIEPGSVMKPFIVAKALDDGKISRNTWFNTSSYELANKRISDTHEYGSLSTEGILQKSSNVGVSKIAAMYDNQTLYNYLSAIGFGRKTQSGVVGEQSAALKAANRWSRLDKAVMSYGYAITANLLQMAQGYTIFTTDGRLQPATIFKQPNPQKGEVILQPETARKMREMMISVTQKGGTGQAGAVPGYDVAGKTGTARKAINGRYEGKYVASFVGFAPAKNPRLIVAVSIDEPVGSYYGGTVAGPVFRGIMEGGLKLLNVAPTYVNADKNVQTAQR